MPPARRLAPGDAIVVLGATRPELGGSEWAAVVHGETGGVPPVADLDAARALHELVAELVADREVTGVHDVSDGGLAVALARDGVRGRRRLPRRPRAPTAAPRPRPASRESASRVVLAVADRRRSPRCSAAPPRPVSRRRWSATRGGDRLVAAGAFDVALADADRAWRDALPRLPAELTRRQVRAG